MHTKKTISEEYIECGVCGVETAIPSTCFVCLSPLVRRDVDGKTVFVCPHEGDSRSEKKGRSKGYGPTTRDIVKGFGLAVKKRREELGLTTAKLAKLADTHQTTVSKIENETRSPSLLLALKLSRGLGVTLDRLIDDAAKYAHM
jgi:DNA-binding XRE family transcriptional regulator